MTRAMQIILAVSLVGLGFTGYLAYRELSMAIERSCPIFEHPGAVFGAPACLYGFFTYLALVVLATIGLLHARARRS